jgi:DNA-binding NarL/FixJ family response regulator
VNHRINLLIVARDAAHRQMVRAWLAGAAGITIVGEARGEPEALTLTGQLQPDVVLLGIGPLGLDDLQTVARLHACYPHSKIIVLGHGDDQEPLALEALREGAWGYLAGERSRPPERSPERSRRRLVEAIRTVARGGAILSPDMAGRVLDEMSRQLNPCEG